MQSNGQENSDFGRVAAAVATYLLRVDRGEAIDREEFIRQHPEIADELRAYFSDAAAMERLIDTSRQAKRPEERSAETLNSTLPGAGLRQGAGSDARSGVEDTGSDSIQYAAGDQIGRYRVVREVGTGGFGRVYLCRDDVLGRDVAVKVPRRRTWLTEQLATTWLEEARVVARLGTKGVAVVHDAGTREDGVPYVVSQFIDGCSLKDRLRQRQPTPTETVDLLAEVAEVVDHAHRAGFVHRDLKPGNILLDRQGRPHVVDFGLAIHETVQRQKGGESGGTPPYMAPEQVRGETQWLDARADIWALGVILYEMLTGRLPFAGDTYAGLVNEILHRDPRPPRQIDPLIPEPLETVVLRCLAKQPADRYATARDLTRALRRWRQPTKRRVWLFPRLRF